MKKCVFEGRLDGGSLGEARLTMSVQEVGSMVIDGETVGYNPPGALLAKSIGAAPGKRVRVTIENLDAVEEKAAETPVAGKGGASSSAVSKG